MKPIKNTTCIGKLHIASEDLCGPCNVRSCVQYLPVDMVGSVRLTWLVINTTTSCSGIVSIILIIVIHEYNVANKLMDATWYTGGVTGSALCNCCATEAFQGPVY